MHTTSEWRHLADRLLPRLLLDSHASLTGVSPNSSPLRSGTPARLERRSAGARARRARDAAATDAVRAVHQLRNAGGSLRLFVPTTSAEAGGAGLFSCPVASRAGLPFRHSRRIPSVGSRRCRRCVTSCSWLGAATARPNEHVAKPLRENHRPSDDPSKARPTEERVD